jgi:hypothetical protein
MSYVPKTARKNIFPGGRYSLLPQLVLFILPDQRLYIVNTHIQYVTAERLYMNYSRYQITLQ